MVYGGIEGMLMCKDTIYFYQSLKKVKKVEF